MLASIFIADVLSWNSQSFNYSQQAENQITSENEYVIDSSENDSVTPDLNDDIFRENDSNDQLFDCF